MSIIGEALPRKDALAKVRGEATFVEDIFLPDMLYGYVLRSPHAYARIESVDVSEAKASSDVAAVLTAEDIPGRNNIPIVFDDLPLLAHKETRFYGEPVVLLAGKDVLSCMKAAQKVKIQYTPLTPILSIEQSLSSRAPRLFGDTNIFSTHRVEQGNIATGFANSDIVLEGHFQTGYQEHAYLERQGAIAIPRSDNGITILGSMQCPFYVHEAIVALLGIPYNRVKVVQTVTGGGFGGKEDVPSIVAGQAALLAYHTRRPVKLIYEREEDMISMSKRHPSKTVVKMGLSQKGEFKAIRIDYKLNAGAYSTLSPVVLWRGTVHAPGPYRWTHVLVESAAVATNLVPCGAFRGFGSPQTIFAMESMVDMAAEKLGMDPAHLRRLNMLQLGDQTVTGHRLTESVGLNSCFEEAHKKLESLHIEKTPPRPHKIRGVGKACFHYGVGLGAGGKHLARAGADVVVFRDGSVNVSVGNTEMGQGAETVLAQIAAQSLNAPYEAVRLTPVDTTRVPDSGPTVASRTTVMSGNAILKATAPILQSLKSAAALMLECSPEQIECENALFFINRQKGEKKEKSQVSYYDVVARAVSERLPLASKGWFISPETTWNAKNGQGDAYMVYSFATIIAVVDVDRDTGEVEVVHIISAHDLGRAINQQTATGQIEGGAVQGMSYALMEDLVLQDGVMCNPNFATYILPTSVDIPQLHPILVEAPYSKGPYGAKGLGEPPLMGIAPAIANAISDALGIRLKKLPILPEDIQKKIRKKEL